MKRSRFSLLVGLVAMLAVAGCGGSETPAETPVAPAATTTSAAPAPTAVSEAEPAPATERFDVDFVEAKMSYPLEKPPRVSVDVPGFDQVIAPSLVDATRVVFKVEGMSGAPEGSYLQLVLDNRPFRPITDLSEKVKLSELAGPDGLAPGEHILTALVNRPNHEFIRHDRGVAVRRFFVGKATQPSWNSRKGPLLVLVSPYQTVVGDPLVDFLVHNAELGSRAYSVRASITGPGINPEGRQPVITEWKPWILLSAREDAEYKLDLRLLDPSGEEVPYGAASTTFRTKKP